MKFKLKALAAVAALAIGGQAHAALSDTFVQDGNLFLTVWNINSPSQSYTRDLGVSLSTFLSSPTTAISNAGDSLFASTFSGVLGSALRWNIIGVDAVIGDGTNDGARVVSTFASLTSLQNSNVDGIANLAVGFAGAMNGAGCSTDVSCATVGAGPTYGGDAQWGADYGAQSNGSNSLGVGFNSDVAFYFLQGAETPNSDLATVTQYGNWSLLDNGTAVYQSAASAVPLPAAAWMLMAGLVGLGGAIRRRRAAAE